jgi:hypothetical protein
VAARTRDCADVAYAPQPNQLAGRCHGDPGGNQQGRGRRLADAEPENDRRNRQREGGSVPKQPFAEFGRIRTGLVGYPQ